MNDVNKIIFTVLIHSKLIFNVADSVKVSKLNKNTQDDSWPKICKTCKDDMVRAWHDRDKSDYTIIPKSFSCNTGWRHFPLEVSRVRSSAINGSSLRVGRCACLWIMSSNLSSCSAELLHVAQSITLLRTSWSSRTFCSYMCL